MIDVGANAGYFTLLWASANASNTILAIEASPRNTELLQHNVRANDLTHQVDIRSVAAGKECGELRFLLGPEAQTGWAGFAEADSAEPSIAVRVETIDSMVEPGRTVDFLKIDVEGADTWVLMGCERLLADRSVRTIHFEQNKPRLRQLGINEVDAARYLAKHGYLARPLSDPSADIVDWVSEPRDGRYLPPTGL